jgi:hypothetical protein
VLTLRLGKVSVMGLSPETLCAVCSKSINSSELIVYAHGTVSHVRCRIQAASHAIGERADRLASESANAPLEQPRPTRRDAKSACPLCGWLTTVTDWRPSVDWLVIEDCQCGGFFLWAGLPNERLMRLSRDTRERLALRVRGLRASGREAWCTTEDGTATGPLVVRTARPDCPK